MRIFLVIIAVSFAIQQLNCQTTTLVSINDTGKLSYNPDSMGIIIPDFSGVGYMNSEKQLPEVPVVMTITSIAGDNVSMIQNAINQVASLPLVNGLRGAILLKSGTYELSKPIFINSAGIVLRGEGQNTILKATGTVQYDLINITGTSGITVISSSQKQVTDSFVAVGAKSVTVQSGHTFVAGDWVYFRREPNQAWIHMLGMDTLSHIDPAATDWTASSYIINSERQITAVHGNEITFDAPVMDIIDARYAKAYVVKITSVRISNCGIENMKLISSYTSSTDELHGWNAIIMDNAEHCWVKKVNAYSFGYSCVNVKDGASFVTVDSCSMIDPVSIITGGRRYSFNIDGQRCLVQNCITRNGRHDYANGSRTAGPNVFYNCLSTLEHADIGPHHRWSTGVLFDNIQTDGQIRVQDRADSGSGHGWSGAQIMFWNCTSPDFVIQDPPSYHCNWAIGCVGPITNIGQWTTNPLGIVQSKGSRIIAIPGLFKAQLAERLKEISTNLNAPLIHKTEFQLIPNPVSKQLLIRLFSQDYSFFQMKITDLNGRIIKTLLSNQFNKENNTDYSLNISDLKSGVYFVSFSTSGFLKTQKLIVN